MVGLKSNTKLGSPRRACVRPNKLQQFAPAAPDARSSRRCAKALGAKSKMVTLTFKTDNCDTEDFYKVEASANGEVELRIEFDRIVSVQSKKKARDDLCSAIQAGLAKFKWICAGPVNVEFLWYLHGTQRQETDKVGDLDNITKPILDALTGAGGLLIDDSQIGSLHTFWQSRNHQTEKDVLYIRLQFINDECLKKENLIFIQYAGAVCLPLNVDFESVRDLVAGLVIIKARLRHRKTAERIKNLGADVDRMLVVSSWDVHRTRLGGFDASNIYQLEAFKAKCCEKGLSWQALIKKLREIKRACA